NANERERLQILVDLPEVELDGHPGVVRRHNESYHVLDPTGPKLVESGGDPRLPVPHSDGHRHGPAPRRQGLLQSPRLGPRAFENGRSPADRGVAASDFLHDVARCGPVPSNVEQIGLDVAQCSGASVRHDENAERLAHAVSVCTRSTTRRTASTGVVGKTPWPRLKMCPGRPSARAMMSWTRASSSAGGANSATGSRFPCTPWSNPMRFHPSSRPIRQSRPMTSPPACTSRGSNSPVFTPKWITGTPRRPSWVNKARVLGRT